MLIQAMPNEFGIELSNGLKGLEPGRRKFAFSLRQIRSVYNDTIGVRSTPGVSRPLGGTLAWQTSVRPPGRDDKPQVQPAQGHPNEGDRHLHQQRQNGFQISFPPRDRGFEQRTPLMGLIMTEVLDKEFLIKANKMTDRSRHLAVSAMETTTQYSVQPTQQHSKKETGYWLLANARPAQTGFTRDNVRST